MQRHFGCGHMDHFLIGLTPPFSHSSHRSRRDRAAQPYISLICTIVAGSVCRDNSCLSCTYCSTRELIDNVSNVGTGTQRIPS